MSNQEELRKRLGHFLLAKRKKAKIGQVELAERVGMKQSWISKMEHGQFEPKLSIAIRVSQVLRFPYKEYIDLIGALDA